MGHMQQHLLGLEVDMPQHLALVPQPVNIVVEVRMTLFHQPRQGDGGPHIGEGVVGVGMFDAVGPAEMLKAETGGAVLAFRPFEALGADGGAQPHQIQYIPAAVAAAPLTLIGVPQVAIQQLAGEFVIEADVVVAADAGAAAGELLVDAPDELGLRHPPRRRPLRRDAGDEAGAGVRQEVIGGAAVEGQGLAGLVQFLVGAQAGELGGPVTPRVGAEGLVVIPVDGGVRHSPILTDTGPQL